MTATASDHKLFRTKKGPFKVGNGSYRSERQSMPWTFIVQYWSKSWSFWPTEILNKPNNVSLDRQKHFHNSIILFKSILCNYYTHRLTPSYWELTVWYTATFLVTLIYLNSAVDAASRGRQDTPQFVFNKRSNKKGKGTTFEHCNYSALQGVYCLDRNQMEIHINIYYRAFQIFTWKTNFKQLTFFMKSLLSSLYISLLWLL